MAHRLAYEAHRGPIPADMQVCHRCDVRACINPDHLFLGTIRDNQADKVSKNRQAKGEKVHLSKLSETQVHEIRAATGTKTDIGQRFGVSRQAVGLIKRRAVWKHI